MILANVESISSKIKANRMCLGILSVVATMTEDKSIGNCDRLGLPI